MKRTRDEEMQPAGRRANAVTIVCLGFLAVFLIAVGALVVADLTYKDLSVRTFVQLAGSAQVRSAVLLSIVSSLITLVLVVLFAVPIGYALSRIGFPGRAVADTIVDFPIVLPPVVIGVSLLVFFTTLPGRFIERMIEAAGLSLHSVIGIVLCQFFVSVSYAIRAAKAAFDSVDRRLENMALTLGCTQWGALFRVSLPLARNGLVAGAVMGWARAIGVFGPLMVFVGTTRMKVEVMPTTIYLELSIGRIEISLAVALMMLLMAGAALVVVHLLTPQRKWF